MTEAARTVAGIVVAYHAADDLDACLAPLAGAIELVVVDNSSSPEVRAVAAGRRVAYVDPGKNVGFAAGVNLGLEHVDRGGVSDILLLNPDAELLPHDLELLVACLRRPGHERVGGVVPRIVEPSGSHERVVWPFPTPWRAWLEAIGLGSLPARHTFVIGAVLLLRAEALAQVGRFDERFFLYAEECDWQRRALAADWTTVFCSEAVARHVGGGTSSDERRREALFHAAHETYIRKWYGPAGWQVYRSAACLGAAGRALVFGGDRRAVAARRAMLYWRGPRRSAALVRD